MFEVWLLLSIAFIASVVFLITKNRKNAAVRRRNGAILIASAPVLFVLSGLFLANTVINPAESLLYVVGEALCYAVAPVLLSSGIVIFWVAPHEKKIVQPQQSPAPRPKKEPRPYSRPRLLIQRMMGLAYIISLLALPFILGGAKEESFMMLIVLFVSIPFPVFTIPYMIAALYLVFNKKRRVIDIPAIIVCPILLLLLLIPSLATIVVFFLPFILFSTPFGLIALALVLAIILIIILVKRRKKRSP